MCRVARKVERMQVGVSVSTEIESDQVVVG